jgi:hypothetical protein
LRCIAPQKVKNKTGINHPLKDINMYNINGLDADSLTLAPGRGDHRRVKARGVDIMRASDVKPKNWRGCGTAGFIGASWASSRVSPA